MDNARVPHDWKCISPAIVCLLLGSGCRQQAMCVNESNRTVSALENGGQRASYLALEAWEENAVVSVRVLSADGSEQSFCSGTLIAQDRILTAAHCVPASADASLRVEVGFEDDMTGGTWASTQTNWSVHPTKDLALIFLGESLPSAVAFVGTILPATALPNNFGDGALLQLGGFGNDEQGLYGQRRFAVETESALDSDAVTVTANGLGGACFGDSGGPALMRGDDGKVVIVGVLQGGTVDCFGRDIYTRVDLPDVMDWLTEQLGPTNNEVIPLGATFSALGRQGRCFSVGAVWTENGALRVAQCGGDAPCGWSAVAQGFRCIARARDSCGGIDDLGICVDGIARRCMTGHVGNVDCSACGWSCGRSPRSGSVECYTIAADASSS